MNVVVTLAFVFVSISALAAEKSYFYCSSDSAEYRTVIIKQVTTNEGSIISSTFKADVTDDAGIVIPFWQDGDVRIGSDDTFKGPFKKGSHHIELDIKAPTFPYFKPRDSTLTDASVIHHMKCNSF